MKIGILTLPLHNNYGGLLQAYALKETLHSMGHETVIINRRSPNISLLRKKASLIKSILFHRSINQTLHLTQNNKKNISVNTNLFIKKYLPELSHTITNNKGMSNLNRMNFDAFIVGSDQCWRPSYSPNIRNYFLDFVNANKNIKKISYAASFGVSDWEFSREDTIICKSLLKKFDAVSAREDTGVELIKKHFDRNDVVHVLDPTLLLSKDHYIKIIESDNIPKLKGDLYLYILDKNKEKELLIDKACEKFGYTPFEVLPQKRLGIDKLTSSNVESFIFPNPTEWLRGFMDAKFIITDSFHGTIFSILFNKPFLSIGNKERGLTRFTSLLNQFQLEEKLITDTGVFDFELHKNCFDWNNINSILDLLRTNSMNFLTRIG